MSKETIKMADVFELPVTLRDGHMIRISESHVGGQFQSAELAEAAAHAINTYDPLVQQNNDLIEALEYVRGIICEGATEGFNPFTGDWAERLYKSNGYTHDVIKKNEKLL